MEILKEIARHNETGLLLFPGDHAEILIDNDYIMASLGVLSRKYPEAALRLLEKSLGITFPEIQEEKPEKPKYEQELEALAAEQHEKGHL